MFVTFLISQLMSLFTDMPVILEILIGGRLLNLISLKESSFPTVFLDAAVSRQCLRSITESAVELMPSGFV